MNPRISFFGEPVVRSFVELFAMMFSSCQDLYSHAPSNGTFFLKSNSNYTVTGAYIQVVKYPIIAVVAVCLYRIMHKESTTDLLHFNSGLIPEKMHEAMISVIGVRRLTNHFHCATILSDKVKAQKGYLYEQGR